MNIDANVTFIGKGSFISDSAVIRGINGPMRKLEIGSNTYIGDNVQIMCDEFSIGDYGKIHHDTNVHGKNPCIIGHNAWIGQFTIIDSTGGIKIGNNVGIGANSQLWTHIKYGDTLIGCNWNKESQMIIEDDCWFVGHCIVSPIHAKAKSMALVGSVVTKDMEYNQVYAGVPAKPINRIQFEEQRHIEMMRTMYKYLDLSGLSQSQICVTGTIDWNKDYFNDDVSYFFALERFYTKKESREEVHFMKYLLPEKAKFLPITQSEYESNRSKRSL